MCAKSSWQVHALCRKGNHFHLVVETPQWNLVAGMKWLRGKRWPWLRVDRLLGESRIPLDRVARRRAAATGADYKAIRRGWCLGEKAFRHELLVQMTERIGAVAGGDAGDGEMDCGEVADRECGRCEQPIVSVAQGSWF